MRLKSLSPAAVFVLVALVVGCGDDDNGDGGQAQAPSPTTTQPTKTTTQPPAASHGLTIRMTEANPASLPKKGGKVDESASVGEIADVEPGFTKKATVQLAPGKYAMVCALPDHYETGMYGSLTVK